MKNLILQSGRLGRFVKTQTKRACVLSVEEMREGEFVHLAVIGRTEYPDQNRVFQIDESDHSLIAYLTREHYLVTAFQDEFSDSLVGEISPKLNPQHIVER